MKNIDFTQTGGFPLTQNQLGYMQTSWQEIVNAMISLGVCNGAPAILSGMEMGIGSTGGPYGTIIGTVSAGWFVYEGVAVRFPAQDYTPVIEYGFALYITIEPTSSSLLYNDGTTHSDVIQDSTGVLSSLPTSTPTDSTHFLFSALTPFGREASFTNEAILVSGPGSATTSGTISYKKNYLTNTLEGYIDLSVNNPSSFASAPAFTLVTVATLPVGYRPVRGGAYFNGSTAEIISFGSGGSGCFNSLTGFINTDGTVNLFLINSSVGTYGGNFSFYLSLD